MPMRLPGEAARAFRDGANLAPQRAVGRRTWEHFLAERLRSDTGPVRSATTTRPSQTAAKG
jgi:hypothetical protein